MSLVLVTGGAGFIGSHVAEALLDAGHAVRTLDVLHAGAHAAQPDYLDPRAEDVRGDVRDPDAVRAALRGAELVCHQAAMVGLGTDLSDIVEYASINDVGTAVLLREIASQRRVTQLVLASSMVIYGEGRYACEQHGIVRPGPRTVADLEAGSFDPRCPACDAALRPQAIPEDAPPDPRNVYAATKLHQEHLAAAFSRETAIPVTALRYHNVYGPRMPRDTPYAGVASIFASALAAGRAPQVFEDGAQLRDFVHVRDVARANLHAFARRATGAFNVCSGTPRSVGEMAHALHAAAAPGTPAPQTTGEFRLGDVRHVFADATRARAVLGFQAREDFGAGMAEFAAAPLRAPVNRA
ncbi:MAG: dTDP-L-rhamnose 4-epimerase [Solirubrobacteraceae bacterium]|jgi:dTDP-L-rhamnose 4-epimerase|nr:dTDP-L-rhamnose 4-epimerase [Solirubrobacteraceae bacterium]